MYVVGVFTYWSGGGVCRFRGRCRRHVSVIIVTLDQAGFGRQETVSVSFATSVQEFLTFTLGTIVEISQHRGETRSAIRGQGTMT